MKLRKKTYYYDFVLEAAESIETIYHESIEPLINLCMDGYNVSVISMGGHGSGKTFALEGSRFDASLPGTYSIQIITCNSFNYVDSCLTQKLNQAFYSLLQLIYAKSETKKAPLRFR